ncbi:uncharacterized protein PRCAT00001127001 [Priceomyces carsonii]|uniref:uncharacterized protein n=1 Tax=Priceomyces carsonii TaxID=28549 RepID=UPI002ED875F8|nr:unnamed protein product [Priceomyces carsonii]
MSFLDNLAVPKNLQEPKFDFLVDSLFSRLDGVRKDNLGQFRNITSKKVHIVKSFVDNFKTHIGDDVFPSSRLIFPNKDKRLYFIRDVTLARLIIKIFNIPRNSEDYNVLFNWKRSYHTAKGFNSNKRYLRNLPLIIARIISNRRLDVNRSERKVTVKELNEMLDKLTNASKSSEQIILLGPLLKSMTVEDIRWLLAIILKVSILNIFEPIFFDSWHPDGARLFRVCNSLEKTFRYLSDPNRRLNEDQLVVHPFLPFLPQLSHKLFISYDQLSKKMKTRFPMNNLLMKEYNALDLENKFIIEEKMDGDRILLHMKNNKFKFFSRRLKDYTLLYGENFHIGSLTKYLSNAFEPGVRSIILDGEMVTWDFKRNVILPFGTLRAAAIQEAVKSFNTSDQYFEQSSYPFFIVFDIIHLNGKNLTSMPLFYRKELLKRLINPVPHRLEILDVYYASTPSDIRAAIKKIVSLRCEGIMVKHIQLKYHINNRSHNWIKIKPEYLEQFGENLDLTVIGKEPGIKNSYMVALKDSNGVFRSFSMVANGFTEYDYDKIERMTHNKWRSFKEFKLPPTLKFGTKRPSYWIHPHESFVLEIKARSIDSSYDTTYAVGSSLHNIYCRSIREDKSPDDCITFEEYNNMRAKYSKNVTKSQTINKRRRLQASFDENVSMTSTSLKVESDLFSSFSFVILTDKVTKDGERIPIAELKKLVKSFQGEVIRYPSEDTGKQIVIICQFFLPVAEVYLKNGYDLVMPDWIFECIRRNAIVELEPVLLFKSKTLGYFDNSRIDKYGDSWIVHTNNLNNLHFSNSLGYREIYEAKQEAKSDFVKYNIKVPLRFLFDSIEFFVVLLNADKSAAKYLKEKIERFGGKITQNLKSCTFVVVPQFTYTSADLREDIVTRVNEISIFFAQELEFNDVDPETTGIVLEGFIDASIKFETLVDVNDFKFV